METTLAILIGLLALVCTSCLVAATLDRDDD